MFLLNRRGGALAGRSEARIFTSIWGDPGFRPLSFIAKTTYLFVLSQPELTHAGVLPLRTARWAAKLNGPLKARPDPVQVTAADLDGAVGELAGQRFLVPDPDTGECLARALVRRDKVLRQPFLFQPFAASVADIESVRILAVLLAEIARVRADGEVNPKITRDVEALVARLERHLDCLPGTHSGTHSDSDPPSHSDRHPDSHSGWDAGTHTGERGVVKACTTGFPRSPGSPSPGVNLAVSRETARVSQPPARPGGGGSSRDETPAQAVDELAAEVRAIRPEWATAKIRRALTRADVAERGWPAVRAAALAVAADPESQAPGRLAGDGPWWHQPPAAAVPPRPPWCGECDERTRQAGDPPRRCPDCHPLEASP